MEPSEPSPMWAERHIIGMDKIISFCCILFAKNEIEFCENKNFILDIKESYENIYYPHTSSDFAKKLYKPMFVSKVAELLQDKIQDKHLNQKEYKYIANAYIFAHDNGIDLFEDVLSTSDSLFKREHRFGRWLDQSVLKNQETSLFESELLQE